MLPAEWLCSSIGKWADTLFSDRLSICICCLAQDLIWNKLICFYALFCWEANKWLNFFIERLKEAMNCVGLKQVLTIQCRKIHRNFQFKWKSCARVWPKEFSHWFCTTTLGCPLGKSSILIARWLAGAQTWTQTWTLPPDQQVIIVFLLKNSE